MFCPNCGTQNPETSQNCSKCNFNLKGAAAPKFKGTMLMMNQSGGATPAPPRPVGASASGAGVAGAVAQPGAVAVGARPAVGAGGIPPKLKGTMVGVAPPSAFGGAGPAPTAPRTPPPPPPGPERFPTPAPQPTPFGASAGVNPLGGTVVADPPNPFAPSTADAFPPAPPPYGPPPGGGGYGAMDPAPPPTPYGAPPPPTGGAYGAPPQPMQMPGAMGGAPPGQMAPAPGHEMGGIMTPAGAYGAPPVPGAYGASPAPQGGFGYGAGPQQGYPMQPAYGMPGAPGPMMGAPMGAPMAGFGQAAPGGGPTRRNALMTMLLPIGVMFGSLLVFGVLSAVAWAPLMILGVLGYFGGLVMILISFIKMINEVQSVTRNPSFAWWPIFIPIYSIYFILVLLPQEVTRAKQMLAVQQPTRSIVVYFFLPIYALAADINDMVR